MKLLGELAATRLPCTVSGAASADRLRVLQAAGCVEAEVPQMHVGFGARPEPAHAVVWAITAHGWRTLETGMPEEDAAPKPLRWSVPLNGTRHRSAG